MNSTQSRVGLSGLIRSRAQCVRYGHRWCHYPYWSDKGPFCRVCKRCGARR
jgi:hypothetical protein